MIRTFTLKSYRGFDEYEMADLTRVNLLVGRNNSGKTSILEAVHFLAARGDPAVLTHSANLRGELNAVEAGSGRQWGGPEISQFFFGHRIKPGMDFHLSSDDKHVQIEVVIRTADIEDEFRLLDDDADQPSLLLQIRGSNIRNSPMIPIAENGALFNLRHLRARNPWSETAPEPPPVQFVTPDSLDFDPMRAMWDNVLIEGRESEVINAMKVLEDDIESIHFLTSELSRVRSGPLRCVAGISRGRPPDTAWQPWRRHAPAARAFAFSYTNRAGDTACRRDRHRVALDGHGRDVASGGRDGAAVFGPGVRHDA